MKFKSPPNIGYTLGIQSHQYNTAKDFKNRDRLNKKLLILGWKINYSKHGFSLSLV